MPTEAIQLISSKFEQKAGLFRAPLLCHTHNDSHGKITPNPFPVKHLFPYSPIHLFTSKKAAFTLAEVLITLGIVGIVATMTIPNLVANYQKKVTVEQLKVAYNIFSNAIELAQVDYGNPIILPEDIFNGTKYTSELSQMYFEPYLKDVKPYPTTKRIYVKTPNRQNICGEFDQNYEHIKALCTQKNICYQLYRHGTGFINFIVDLNGPKGPNVMGRDVFVFDMTNYTKGCLYGGGYHCLAAPHPYIEGSWSAFGRTIDGNCNKNSDGRLCASKIIRDGWQIKDDYPW